LGVGVGVARTRAQTRGFAPFRLLGRITAPVSGTDPEKGRIGTNHHQPGKRQNSPFDDFRGRENPGFVLPPGQHQS
jgi:hypothetical protein